MDNENVPQPVSRHEYSPRSSGAMNYGNEASDSNDEADKEDDGDLLSDGAADLLVTDRRNTSEAGQQRGAWRKKPRSTSSTSWGDGDSKVIPGLDKPRNRPPSDRHKHMTRTQQQQLRRPGTRTQQPRKRTVKFADTKREVPP